ncbi:hypothetical protein SSX86_027565 [Deinandra increscens subsp. villosa]|uniref:Uncharacterized protein n=1 Tax=Deinandra increscens subsp. villosa TaxID=3103831 RepID=A0AAP0GKF9_9ASTR
MSQVMPTVYPVTNTLPPTSGSSNGSYGSVFIVLAAIIIVSALACFLGRLCNKRQNASRPPSTQSRPKSEKDTKRNTNVIHTKDGDIEFGYDKRFASAKAATANEPNMTRPDPFGEPNMARPNSFREPTVGRNDGREPTANQPNPFHKSNKVQPSSYNDSPMGRSPDSFREPTIGQSNSFQNGESQGRQVRFGGGQDNEPNFKIRTRAHRY